MERLYHPMERLYVPMERLYVPMERLYVPMERLYDGCGDDITCSQVILLRSRSVVVPTSHSPSPQT